MSKPPYLQIGLLMFGLGLAEATVHTVHGPRWQKRMSMVGYYLFCDFIEQMLHSRLKKSGLSKRKLRRIRRDLPKVVNSAVENGIEGGNLSPELMRCIGMLNAYYSEKEFEYFSREMGMRLPDATQFAKTVKLLLARLDEQYRAEADDQG